MTAQNPVLTLTLTPPTLEQVIKILEGIGVLDKGFLERYKKVKILVMRDRCGSDCQEQCAAEDIERRLKEMGYRAESFPNARLVFVGPANEERWIEQVEYWLYKKIEEARDVSSDVAEKLASLMPRISYVPVDDSARVIAAERMMTTAIVQDGDWDRVYFIVTDAPVDVAKEIMKKYEEECEKLELEGN